MKSSRDMKPGAGSFLVYLFMFAAIASIVGGLFMAIYDDNPAWLLLCLPIVLFLS